MLGDLVPKLGTHSQNLHGRIDSKHGPIKKDGIVASG